MTIFEQRTHEMLQQACSNISELTLRDLFAMSTISGLNSNNKLNDISIEDLATIAYQQADAMLEERSKK